MNELTDEQKMRLLPWNFASTAASSVFGSLTYFGPVFVLYLSELGLAKSRIGLLLSLLPFAGLVSLVLASWAARVGVKRVFLIFYSTRKFVTALLLLAPWVMVRHGSGATFVYVSVLVGLFALCRAIAETAVYPWFQEVVPDQFRGRYNGTSYVIGLIASSLALAAASHVVGRGNGLDRYLDLIGAGVIFGFASAILATRIPGGEPNKNAERAHFPSLRKALQDPNLRLYLIGMGLVALAHRTVLTAFLPLFMKEQVGLADSQILLVQVLGSLAALPSAYLWGRAADRAGSKPALLAALYLLLACPLIWLFMPRQQALGFVVAGLASTVLGIASAGFTVADQRLLYVDVVPDERRTEYMAVYYAWMGLLGGLGPLLAGYSLDHLQGLSRSWFVIPLDPYSPLFLTALVLIAVGTLFLARLGERSTLE